VENSQKQFLAYEKDIVVINNNYLMLTTKGLDIVMG